MQEKKKSHFLGFECFCLMSSFLLSRPKLFSGSGLKFIKELVPDVCRKSR